MGQQRHDVKSSEMDKFVVRLPNDMREELKTASVQEFMSMNSFVIRAIANELKRVKQ